MVHALQLLPPLELCPIWPAVTHPTLLELCRAWPAVTPEHYLSCDAMCAKSNPPPPPPSAACSLHVYSYIQQSGRSVKSMNAKNTRKKSPIHENADAYITCGFGDGDISRSRSRFPHTQTASHIVSSIIAKNI